MVYSTVPRLMPKNQHALIACLILVSVIDSVLVGYNSSLMGSFNVMPSYTSYVSSWLWVYTWSDLSIRCPS